MIDKGGVLLLGGPSVILVHDANNDHLALGQSASIFSKNYLVRKTPSFLSGRVFFSLVAMRKSGPYRGK